MPEPGLPRSISVWPAGASHSVVAAARRRLDGLLRELALCLLHLLLHLADLLEQLVHVHAHSQSSRSRASSVSFTSSRIRSSPGGSSSSACSARASPSANASARCRPVTS